jgi:hypothetical protein
MNKFGRTAAGGSFGRNGGSGGRGNFGRDAARKQFSKQTPTPPRTGDKPPPPCGNCGAEGHDSRNCPQPRLAMDKRLCHKCKKPGHGWRQCPLTKGSGQLAIADGAAQIARGERSYGLMITSSSDGWKHVTRRSHAMALGDACAKEKGSQREGGRRGSSRLHRAFSHSSPRWSAAKRSRCRLVRPCTRVQ